MPLLQRFLPCPQNSIKASAEQLRTLRLYLVYRVMLAILMLLIFFSLEHGPLGPLRPSLFAFSVVFYLLISVAALAVLHRCVYHTERQAMWAALSDIGCFSVMIFASGGVQSGLGMLIAIAIALGAMSTGGRNALLLAAIASLAILAEQFVGQWSRTFDDLAYTQAGLLGASFFALAALAHQLATRAQRSEQLADQRGQDLAHLSQLNALVIQQIRAGILVIGPNDRVQTINVAAWSLLGMPEECNGCAISRLSPSLNNAYRVWKAGRKGPSEAFVNHPGGKQLRADFTRLDAADQQATLVVLEDLALLTAEAQQMKLASLGRLTAGIAHEIRNPLAAISHAAQLLEESDALAAADRRMSQIIHNNSIRVNEVVQNILKLSRQSSPQPRQLQLLPWLSQLRSELAQAHGLRDQQIELTVKPEDLCAFADQGQVRQILEILSENAISHGAQSIEQLQITIGAEISRISGDVVIEVRDNGPGISAEHIEHLFEPFFTTRTQGTGLGLYIARQLSEANQIRLEYQHDASEGSCFRLSFARPPNQ